jgi:hypothetical protein
MFLTLTLSYLVYSQLSSITKKGSKSGIRLIAALSFPLIFLSSLGLAGGAQILFLFSLSLTLSLVPLRPAYGSAILIFILLTRPWEIGDGWESLAFLPKYVAGILSVTFLTRFFVSSRSLVIPKEFIVFLLYLLWIFTSTAIAAPSEEWLAKYFEIFYPTIFLSLLIIATVNDEISVNEVLLGFILGSIALGGTAFFTANSLQSGRLSAHGMWGNANDLGALLVITIPLAICNPLLHLMGRVSLGSFAVYLLWWTKSRGASLAIAVGGIATLLSVSKRHLFRALPLLLLGGVILSMTLYYSGRTDADTQGSFDQRYAVAISGFRMARANPLFGVGLGSFERMYNLYSPLFIEKGSKAAHSSWILALAEGSIVGFIFFVYLMWRSLITSWRNRFHHPGLFISTVAYLIAISFLTHTYLILPYFLLFLNVSVAKLVTRRSH